MIDCRRFRALIFLALVVSGLCQADPLWSNSAPLLTPRGGHTATVLPDGKVLVAGGETGNNAMASAERYDPASNAWTGAGALKTARFQHVATLLTKGKVLVTGGMYFTNVTDTRIAILQAELYDPAANSWSVAASLKAGRAAHTATLLANGKVLVVGGIGQAGHSLASAELYDPDTNTWSDAASMATARFGHTATLLEDGRVLVVAGASDGPGYLAGAELYDPIADAWNPAASMTTARGFHTATLLPDGRVVVVAGIDSTNAAIASVEVYNATMNTWAPGASAYGARYRHRALLLPSGQVFVTGGDDTFGSAAYEGAEIYDPQVDAWFGGGSAAIAYRDSHTASLLATGQVLIAGGHIGGTTLASTGIGSPALSSWNKGSSSGMGHRYAATTLLPNGKVLLAGGYGYVAPELYDPATKNWSSAGANGPVANLQTSTLLASGKVLVAGGGFPALYDASADTWAVAAYPGTQRVFHSATLLANGDVLVTGGFDPNQPAGNLAGAERYVSASDYWIPAGTLNIARESHTATLLANGRVLVAGGNNGSVLDQAELYDAQGNAWAPTSSMLSHRAGHSATLLPGGRVLVAGGYSNIDRALASCELYDPPTGNWIPAGGLNVAREGHTATLLPDGTVLVSGGAGGSGPLTSAERYDPIANTWIAVADLATARTDHAATLLLEGTVLIATGEDANFASLSSSEIFDPGLAPVPARQPLLVSVPTLLNGYSNIVVSGAGFRPNLEGSGGDQQGSTSNHPSIQVRRLDNGEIRWLTPDSATPVTDTLVISGSSALSGFPHGPVLISVFVSGIPSASRMTVLDPGDQLFIGGFE